MERVEQHYYKSLHWILVVFSGLLGLVYPVLYWIKPAALEPLGLTQYVFVAAVIAVFYGVAVWPIAKRRLLPAATFVTLLATTALVAMLIAQTGGLASIYLATWILVLLVAGAFGGGVLVVYSFIATLYIGFSSAGDFSSLDPALIQNLVKAAVMYLAGILSYLFWRRHYLSSNDNKAVALGKRLRSEQLKSELLVSSITDGVVIVDTEEHIQLINPAGAKMIGWSLDEAANLDFHSLFSFFVTNGKDIVELDGSNHPFKQVLTTGKPINRSDIFMRTKTDKQQIAVSLNASPIRISESEVNGIVVIFRDVSAERAQQQQQSEFVSTASHEMRTPVAAIEGYLSLALNNKVCEIDSKARSFLEKAHESTQHLGELFRDLLAISKSEDGRLESHPMVLELGSFIERVIEDSRFTAEKKGLTLSFLVAAQRDQQSSTVRPLYYIYADPERIREALANLINNAIKFTQEGSVTVGLRGEDGFVQISIKDTGIGITSSDIPHLFQKFYRIDNSATRTIGGTGLGLYITRKVIEFYKGRVWVESKLGEGSTFFINLPRLDTLRAQEQINKEKELPLSSHVENRV